MAFSGAFIKPFRPAFDAGLAAAGNGLLNNLVAYWALDEATGNRADSHGANTLTPVGAGVSYAAAKIGNGVSFAAANNYLNIADNSAVSLDGTDWTLACWCYATAFGGAPANTLLCKATTSNEWELIYRGPTSSGSSRFRMSVFGSTATSIDASTPTPVINTWYFVAAWLAGNTLSIQVNNGTVYSTTLLAAVPVTNAPFRIGSYGTGNQWLGIIDEAAIWHAALTAAQRTALFNSGAGLAYAAFTT